MKRPLVLAALLLCFVSWNGTQLKAEDLVEFLHGAKVTGTVKQIRKDKKEFDFEAKVGTRNIVRTYPFSKVHAVTFQGKRFVLTPLATHQPVKTDASGRPLRSKSEVERLIELAGTTPPDWFDSTSLDYPPTLDLQWPVKPEGQWNSRKNMGQYIWDVIHPNPSKWQSGIKLVHHCMDLHQGNATLLKRDRGTLGRMYFDLLQDYPRAAYWIRKAGITKGQRPAVMLAECYWQMGNEQLARQNLVSRNYSVGAAATAIKLYGNMGDIPAALKMNDLIARTAASYEGFIVMGDAMRQAGRYDQAIEFYEKVLRDDSFRNKDYEKRFKARAQESIDAIELFEKVDVNSIADGTYTGHSSGYNGRLEVAVGVRGGKIESVKVTQHREKQFYSAMTDTEASILARQTVRGVDGTSGATITSRAIVNATATALAGAPK